MHRHEWAPINAREQECLDCEARRDIPYKPERQPVWIRRMQQGQLPDKDYTGKGPDAA
jgi:hypothetical protein